MQVCQAAVVLQVTGITVDCDGRHFPPCEVLTDVVTMAGTATGISEVTEQRPGNKQHHCTWDSCDLNWIRGGIYMGAARAWDGHHGTFSSTFNRRRKSRMPVDALLAF